MAKDKLTPIAITTRSAGVHFGTVGQVRRRNRIIHETQPRPYGFRAAAADDAKQWAIDHGYIMIDDTRALRDA